MKNILKSIIFLIALATCIWLYFDFSVNDMNKDYLVSYGRGFKPKFDKLQRIKGNKIVIVGGSNVNFGIDSDLMEISLGIPVVNMGLHAGFNTFNIIDPVTPYLKDGDILIISREFNEKLYGASVEVSNYFEFMPLLAKWEVYKNLDAISPILKCHVQNSQNNIVNFTFTPQNTFKQGIYTAKAFKNDNIYNNIINFQMPKSTYKNFKTKELSPPNSSEIFQYYQNLKKDLNNKGIKVYFSMPAIAANYFSSEDIITYYQTLSHNTGIELLSNRTFEYPREKLLNSMYHLNADGRKERSLALSNDLSNLLHIKLKSVNNCFFATSTIANSESLLFNDLRQCRLVDNELTFINYDKDPLANYFRIKVPDSIDSFNNKYFKIEVEGDEKLIDDLRFRAIGEPQKWDLKYTNKTKHILIKNNIQGTIYKDGNSYLGISLVNLTIHHNSSIKINKIEISDTPFIVKPLLKVALNQSLVIDSRNSDSELVFKNNEFTSRFAIHPNNKYIITNETDKLLITNLYSDSTISIKKTENNTDVTIQFPSDLLEVFELKI